MFNFKHRKVNEGPARPVKFLGETKNKIFLRNKIVAIFCFLTGVCHEIFYIHFFHDSNPSGSLINRLKHFRICFRFRRDIWSQSWLLYSLFIRGPGGFESWIKWRFKISWHTPFNRLNSFAYGLNFAEIFSSTVLRCTVHITYKKFV